MKIENYIVGPVQTNCYFAYHDKTKELLVVDPGDGGKQLAEMIKEKGYHPAAILLTHGHFDHADGIEDLKEALSMPSLPVYACEAEKETLSDPRINLSATMGWNGKSYHADRFLKDGETFSEAGFTIKMLHTPGHTEGGCCFYIEDEDVLFSGDSLFAGSIGRTDFPGGSMSKLVRSVKEKCFSLPDETHVLPGHDDVTTIGRERQYNPYFA